MSLRSMIALGVGVCSVTLFHGPTLRGATLAFYQMGEKDSSKVSSTKTDKPPHPGDAVTSAVDGALTLNDGGSAKYINPITDPLTTPTSHLPPSSSLAVDFGSNANGSYLAGSDPFAGATDGIGVEAWVRADASGSDKFVLLDQDAGGNGISFIQNKPFPAGNSPVTFVAGLLTGGSDSDLSSNLSFKVGDWVELALVLQKTGTGIGTKFTALFYINGKMVSSTAFGLGGPLSDFRLGNAPFPSDNPLAFSGAVDDVRFFSFAQGPFDASTLAFNSQAATPEPGTLVLAAVPMLMLFLGRGRARGVG